MQARLASPSQAGMIMAALVALMLVVLSIAATAQVSAPSTNAQVATSATATVPILQINGPIGPATAEYFERGLNKAMRDGAPAIVLQLNTPGGLDSSTRGIVQAILASTVPVVTWVAPSGARAASAGVYIAYASHIAAMAPGTNLGAATPIKIGGMPKTQPNPEAPGPNRPADDRASEPGRNPQRGPADGDAMTRKMVNDSAAYLRSLAQMRGRNVDWADLAVREGVSLSATEALVHGVIDFIAADLPTLLEQAHGRQVRLRGGPVHTVNSRGAPTSAIEPDWRIRLLSVITDPSVAYLLLLAGIYGLYFELTSPGFGVPGIAGSISLLLGLFALQMLPVSYAGLALIVLGFMLLIAEAWLPTFGALGIGGVIAFVIGSVMLIDTDTPGFGIPVHLIATVAVLNVLFLVVVLKLALKSKNRPVVSGEEQLPGAHGQIVQVTPDAAWMWLQGERWRVVSTTPLQTGQHVRVIARSGLVLQVEPDASQATPMDEPTTPSGTNSP